MKTYIIRSIARSLIGALLIAAAVPAALAAPAVYTPVKTLREAKEIKPGDQIAIECGDCGALTTITADRSRSYLKGYTCKTCGVRFKTISVGNVGNGGPIGAFVYEDGSGHQSKLFRVK
jgi:predicted RNA-binding Zn-ribbon protein involved in translation (DUF1610 family)